MTPDQRDAAHSSRADTAETRTAPAAAPAAGPRTIVELAAGSGVTGDCLCFEDELDEAIVVIPLALGQTRIGRGLAADVRFDDPTVSRRHALVVRGPDGVVVFDERSRNGVLVNGRPVGSSRLEHGDEIRIGRRLLCYAHLERRDGAGDAEPAMALVAV